MRKPLKKEDVLKRFYSKHNKDLYEIDLSDYKNSQSLIKLKCREHGFPLRGLTL